MTKKNEIQKTEAEELALYDYGDDAGAGFDDLTSDDKSTPFLKLLQNNSPEVEEQINGARAGKFYHTGTGQVYDSVPFILVGKTHNFLEFVPRTQGGGLVAVHDLNSPTVQQAIANNGGSRFGKLTTPEGHEVVENHTLALLLLDEEEGAVCEGAVVMGFKSTMIKPMKQGLSKMDAIRVNGKRVPMFAVRGKLVGYKDPRTAKGTFYNVRFEPLFDGSWVKSLVKRHTEATLYGDAKAVFEQFKAGEVKVDYSKTQNESGEPADDAAEAF